MYPGIGQEFCPDSILTNFWEFHLFRGISWRFFDQAPIISNTCSNSMIFFLRRIIFIYIFICLPNYSSPSGKAPHTKEAFAGAEFIQPIHSAPYNRFVGERRTHPWYQSCTHQLWPQWIRLFSLMEHFHRGSWIGIISNPRSVTIGSGHGSCCTGIGIWSADGTVGRCITRQFGRNLIILPSQLLGSSSSNSELYAPQNDQFFSFKNLRFSRCTSTSSFTHCDDSGIGIDNWARVAFLTKFIVVITVA